MLWFSQERYLLYYFFYLLKGWPRHLNSLETYEDFSAIPSSNEELSNSSDIEEETTTSKVIIILYCISKANMYFFLFWEMCFIFIYFVFFILFFALPIQQMYSCLLYCFRGQRFSQWEAVLKHVHLARFPSKKGM